MKRGFTLVEMLIVVAVLVTLMGMVFRLGSVGGDSSRRTVTISRLQRLENAISGYYAAFGTYPPVGLHGSRNIYLSVNNHGVQNRDGKETTSIWGWISADGLSVKNWTQEQNAWRQVKAACRSQPVESEFPFPDDMRDVVDAKSEELRTWAEQSEKMGESTRSMLSQGFDDGVTRNVGRHAQNGGERKTDWRDLQLFKFGLMSYLLPRYMIMMNGNEVFFRDYVQWTANNFLPSDPMTGNKIASWRRLQDYAHAYLENKKGSDAAVIANIPSQAACARWMAAFEGTLCCNYDMSLFGVNVRGTGLGQDGGSLPSWNETYANFSGEIYSPGGYDNDATSGQYILDKITIRDGWGNDLYYYSPAPHQTYTVWSSGPNGRTFPPWVSMDDLEQDAKKCATYWNRDDIVSLRH